MGRILCAVVGIVVTAAVAVGAGVVLLGCAFTYLNSGGGKASPSKKK